MTIGGLGTYGSIYDVRGNQSTKAKNTASSDLSKTMASAAEMSTVRSRESVHESVVTRHTEYTNPERITSTRGIERTNLVTNVKDMTMEEYKQYISDQISKFRIDPSRSGDQYSINISDAGFEAMKNDSEYEKWVLDYIRRDMAVAAPGWYTAMGGPSAYCILNFGATKEERTGEMFSAGYMNGKGTGIFNSHADKSFWTKRSEQKKIQERIDKKAAEKKELEEKWLLEAAEKRQAYTDFLNGKTSIKTNSFSEFNDFFQMPTDPKVAGILSAYESGTFVGGGLM